MRIATILGLSIVLASPALAASDPMAQVANFSGKVLISHGKGFAEAVGNPNLKSGDAVFIGDNSSVTIAYSAAKCSVTYSTPQTFNVPVKAPCTEGQMLGQVDNLSVEPAGLRQVIHQHDPFTFGTPSFVAGSVFATTALTALYQETRKRASAP